MPFDHLNNALGSIPDIAHATVQPAPPVIPLAEIVDRGVEGVNNIIKKFGPMETTKMKMEIARNSAMLNAYQRGARGDLKGMHEDLKWFNENYNPLQDQHIKAQIAKENALAENARKGRGMPAPHGASTYSGNSTVPTNYDASTQLVNQASQGNQPKGNQQQTIPEPQPSNFVPVEPDLINQPPRL